MKKINRFIDKHLKILIVIFLILNITGAAVLLGTYKAPEVKEVAEVKEIAESALPIPGNAPADNSKSRGEIGRGIYSIEIWEDGTARIYTLQGYINEPEENLLIITDKKISYNNGIIETEGEN